MRSHAIFPRSPFGGFSLVEVTLALGIISFAFVALLALIPIGLGTFRTAIDATVETQIVQRVATVARQAKFSALNELDRHPGMADGVEQPDFFFDEQGGEIVDEAVITAREYIYTAAVTVQGTSELPAGGGARESNGNLATVVVMIRRISAPKEVRYASIAIANNGL